jgi:BirA family biotin operon repressor/biotin-[acetyl-CoA-carboxylase] ligase
VRLDAATSAYRHEAFDALGSTNDEAMARARAGDPGKLWITAAQQSAGRGRLGRTWQSPQGNLYASLLLVDAASPDRAPELGFVAGVALIDALRDITGARDRLKIKWPNDALLDGGKLAGLLLEATQLAGGAFACVIGIGVNCASCPADLPYAASNLAAFGPRASREKLFPALAAHLANRLDQWSRGEGFPAIRNAWLAVAAGVGEQIEVANGEKRLKGVFRTIDSKGRLVLGADAGETLVEAGDIFLKGQSLAGGDPGTERHGRNQ